MTPNSISAEEGENMRMEINANQLLECSAKQFVNINEVIYESVRASVMGVPEVESQSSCMECLGGFAICAAVTSLFQSGD